MKKKSDMDSRKLLAKKSIEYLFGQANENPDYAPTLIKHAIAYKKRHRVPFTWSQKRSYCENCLRIYDGKEKVRVTKSGMTIICPFCGHKRMLRHPH
jgi:RNase P subunit RPR2